MTDFGPFISYSDPRIYGLIEGYRWGEFQRSLLLGQRSWEPVALEDDHRSVFRREGRDRIIECFTERGFRVGMGESGVLHVLADLPPEDPMLPTLLEQWGIAIPKVTVLSLEGPVETIGSVPIFKAAVFGYTERADGERCHGLNNDAWIVGRVDVCHTRRMPAPNWSQNPGARVARYDGVRGTLKRARNTAREVAAAMPEWEEFLAWKTRQAQAAEDARLEAERKAEEIDDPGVEAFAA